VVLAENYGQPTDKGSDILNIPYQDLANVTDISLPETAKIMEKLLSKGWLSIDENEGSDSFIKHEASEPFSQSVICREEPIEWKRWLIFNHFIN
jgi:hypothetical protein